MGWSNCGTDSRHRPIGYAVSAICDQPGCKAKIHRGLSYACGGMHGEGNIHDMEGGCEGYFCSDHLQFVENSEGHCFQTCSECAEPLLAAEQAREKATPDQAQGKEP